MATLTNPVSRQNIIDRFSDYVTATANADIVWGTDALPTHTDGTVVTLSANFGGTTDGRTISINGDTLGASGDTITAITIYNAVLSDTNRYTRIRKLRARLNVTGTGGNTGTRPKAGIIYDETAVAHMNNNYLQDIGYVDSAGVESGQIISSTNLETLFDNLRTAYNTKRDVTVTLTRDVCHASCHSSCHASRGRR